MLKNLKAKMLEYRLNKIIRDLEAKGKIDQALSHYTRLLREIQELPMQKKLELEARIHGRLANIYMYKNELKKAELHASKAYELSMRISDNYTKYSSKLIMASFLYRTKKHVQAERILDEILAFKPKNKEEYEIVVWARILKTKILVENNRCNEAKTQFNLIEEELKHLKQLKFILEELGLLKKEISSTCR
ncbi:MAG: hypothetical protein GXO43_00495 [Crenarchaeota archaeon]|nr:hypothetical protein [Thermoproteota archaeon]